MISAKAIDAIMTSKDRRSCSTESQNENNIVMSNGQRRVNHGHADAFNRNILLVLTAPLCTITTSLNGVPTFHSRGYKIGEAKRILCAMSSKDPPEESFLPTKVSVYIATSIDGFIARLDGSLDWLPGSDGSATTSEDADVFGYEEFMASVNVIMMGRNTFDFVHSASSSSAWPYDKPVVVLSTTMKELPSDLKDKDVILIADSSPQELVEMYAGQHIYVDGGKMIQSFLRANLVTDIQLFRVPILLGKGIPLFSSTESFGSDIPLKHIETKVDPKTGIVSSKYFVNNPQRTT
jgi:dihydrofolate reductase